MKKKYILTDVTSKKFNLDDIFVSYIPSETEIAKGESVGWSEDISVAVRFESYSEAEDAVEKHGLLREVVIEEIWV